MTDEDIIARCVARLENRAEQHSGGFDDMPTTEIVRCVIEGMRAPTEAMLKAAERAGAYDGSGRYQAKRLWPAMIDAALGKQP